LRTIVHEDNRPVVGVRFSPNGKYVLAWTLDSSIRLWNYQKGNCVKTYQGHTNQQFCIVGGFGTFGPPEYSSAFIVSGSEDGSIWIWDVGTKKVLQRIDGAHEGVVFAIDTDPTSQLIASAGGDMKIRVWRRDDNTTTGSEPVDS
jgi:COMPASS component SWD3